MKSFGIVLCAAVVAASFIGDDATAERKGIRGRYLVVDDGVSLGDYRGALLIIEPAEITSDQYRSVATEDVRRTSEDLLREKLEKLGVFAEILTEIPAAAPEGRKILKAKTRLTLQHGSRATRFLISFGAGKSKLHIRIDFIDARTGKHVAFFNGYGSGAGILGWQGGAVQRMARDDLRENYNKLARLLLNSMDRNAP